MSDSAAPEKRAVHRRAGAKRRTPTEGRGCTARAAWTIKRCDRRAGGGADGRFDRRGWSVRLSAAFAAVSVQVRPPGRQSARPARGSDVTISKLLDEQGVETVPHGFRSGSGNGRPKPPTAPGRPAEAASRPGSGTGTGCRPPAGDRTCSNADAFRRTTGARASATRRRFGRGADGETVHPAPPVRGRLSTQTSISLANQRTERDPTRIGRGNSPAAMAA